MSRTGTRVEASPRGLAPPIIASTCRIAVSPIVVSGAVRWSTVA